MTTITSTMTSKKPHFKERTGSWKFEKIVLLITKLWALELVYAMRFQTWRQ